MELKAISSPRAAALVEARRLLRAFASAPDARQRAQAVLSELRHASGWPLAARRRLEAADTWLLGHPAVEDMEPGLRGLLAELQRTGADTKA